MNGQEVYKFAVNTVSCDLEAALKTRRLRRRTYPFSCCTRRTFASLKPAVGKMGIPGKMQNQHRPGSETPLPPSVPILLDETRQAGRSKAAISLLCRVRRRLTSEAASFDGIKNKKEKNLWFSKKLKKILVEYKGCDEEKIAMGTSFGDLGLDSLDTVDLVMSFEEEFGVSIEMDENIRTVGDVVALVEKEQCEKQ
jgi:acyl carrier protein